MTAAPRTELPRLAAAMWKAHAAGAIGDTEAQGLAEAIARRPPWAAGAAPDRDRANSSLIPHSRISLPRHCYRVGLHIVLFEACSAFSRVAVRTLAPSPICDRLTEGFSHFVTSMTAPSCFRFGAFVGWGLHPLESAAFSRRTQIAAIRRRHAERLEWPQSARLGRAKATSSWAAA